MPVAGQRRMKGWQSGLFCFVFDLVQYKNETSGSFESRREMKESGSCMATKRTRGTAQLLLSRAVAENSIFLHMVIWASVGLWLLGLSCFCVENY